MSIGEGSGALRPALPEVGSIVQVRGATWAVTDVREQGLSRSPADEARSGLQHVVVLQSLEEDRMGEELSVVWELEVGQAVIPDQGLPDVINARSFDDHNQLGAFVDAMRWGAVTSADTVRILRSIQGAHEDSTHIRTVWTAPHGLVHAGALNSARGQMVMGAKHSIVCSTLNFEGSSDLWDALRAMERRGGVAIRLYLDTNANRNRCPDAHGYDESRIQAIAAALPHAHVFKTAANEQGWPYRNHAKFLSIDRKVLLVTSANFSLSAEEFNIELGLRIDNAHLAKSVEDQMRQFEHILYQRVQPE